MSVAGATQAGAVQDAPSAVPSGFWVQASANDYRDVAVT
jgi:hypothetical protein